jgi:hypothetical protein
VLTRAGEPGFPWQVSVAADAAATSCVTAEKTSAGATPCATSVATRRSAACSAATRSSACRVRETASRDSAFAMAVATSWENLSRRSSVSSGRPERGLLLDESLDFHARLDLSDRYAIRLAQ